MGFRSPLNGLPPSSITADMLADGAVTGSKLSADAIDGKTITGALVRTAAAGERVELYSDGANHLRFYTGDGDEVFPGFVIVDNIPDGGSVASTPFLRITSPEFNSGNGGRFARIELEGRDHSSTQESAVRAWPGFSVASGPGRPVLHGFDYGVNTGTADANGDLTIPHNVGSNPTSVVVVSRQSGVARFYAVVAKDSSSFTIRSRDIAGNPVSAGTTISAYWIAFT